MNKFKDIELPFEDSVFIVPANKVMKLYRTVSPLAKMDYFARVEAVAVDEPMVFSDAYTKALEFGRSDIDLPSADEVFMWMESGNLVVVLESLMAI